MSILSENIKALRLRHSNQTEFGERVGVGQSTVVRWEKGSDPKPENLLALAKLAKATIEQIITMPLEDIPDPSEREPIPTPAQLEAMISLAMKELRVGATNEDYQRVVASSLHAQLEQFRSAGGFRDSSAASTVPGKGAPPPVPTKKGGRAGSRTP